MNLKDRAKTLKRDIPAVFIALSKKETPILAKIIAGLTVGYALSPIDIIPDFIPVIGYLDDLIILPALISLTIKLVPSEIFAQCRIESENLWKNGKPKKWYFALPIIFVWLFIIYIIFKAIIK